MEEPWDSLQVIEKEIRLLAERRVPKPVADAIVHEVVPMAMKHALQHPGQRAQTIAWLRSVVGHKCADWHRALQGRTVESLDGLDGRKLDGRSLTSGCGASATHSLRDCLERHRAALEPLLTSRQREACDWILSGEVHSKSELGRRLGLRGHDVDDLLQGLARLLQRFPECKTPLQDLPSA